ncbi:MAG: glutathione S-transferase family protein [Pseudomonadota bacterium]|nr:glutathione S-transferase family protein [Pseudomonadota bacterium]
MAIGDKLASAMQLHGNPSCIETAKCIQTAAEKGVDIEAKTINSGDEVINISPLAIGPVLQDQNNTVYGPYAIMSYLDDKGFGPSLVPRNGVIRAVMYQFAHIATEVVQGEAAATLSGGGDMDKLNKSFDILEHILTTPPDPKIGKGVFICGEFSLADIHWMACANMLEITGNSNIITSRSKTTEWCNAVKEHPATSKEKIIPYTFIATKADIDSNTLRNVGINVV